MIPLENRNYLIKKLKEGMDIRNACDAAKISRPQLYACYKELPEFKSKVELTIRTAQQRSQTASKMAARHALRRQREDMKK
ncbi:MAG: hypothetical protein V4478_03445 [Patescibacteria group bacterium]